MTFDTSPDVVSAIECQIPKLHLHVVPLDDIRVKFHHFDAGKQKPGHAKGAAGFVRRRLPANETL
ncbi:hypothetical protein [Mesorhizobium xinjiangense]|uniref:hypothetical protein n=1 Tax=Mesorhizobium xinjiangense TaxID=2678685 RepID=UPI0012EE6198|nr:hypothetical protein [Mesorhizobium xinjiangense]